MGISLSAETQRLIEERMKQSGFSTADDLVRAALQTLDEVRGEPYDRLAEETRQAIDEAEAQHARGQGIPLDEAFDRLRRKHLGR